MNKGNGIWILLSVALFVIVAQAAIDVTYRNGIAQEREGFNSRIGDLEMQNDDYAMDSAMYECELPCDELEDMVEESELLAQAWWRQATHCMHDIDRIRIGN